MQFTLSKKDIIESAAVCKALSGKKSSQQIGNDIKLDVTGDTLKIVATDLESTFIGKYPVTDTVDGAVLVNGSRFFDILSTFPEDTITLVTDKGLLLVKNDSVKFSIPWRDADLFFSFPDIIVENTIEIEGQVLKEMIGIACLIGADSTDRRQHIIGANFEFMDGYLRIISTDSARMNLNTLKHDGCKKIDEVLLVPKYGLTDLAKMIGKVSVIRIGIAEGYFVVSTDKYTFLTRMLAGSFPDVDRLLNINGKQIMYIDKGLFIDTLERAGVMVDKIERAAKFTFKDDTIKVENCGDTVGVFEETHLANEGEVTETVVFLNQKYLYDAVKTIDGDNIRIAFSDDKSPFFVTDVEENLVNVLMPMRM